MMKPILLLLLSPLIPFAFYSAGDGAIAGFSFYAILIAASLISCLTFFLLRKILRSEGLTVVLGGIISFVLFGFGTLSTAWISGSFAETFMWFPIIALFGIPALLPVVIAAYFAARAFRRYGALGRRTMAEQGTGGNAF